MSVIKPVVGRVVWFYPMHHTGASQPLAAIIAHVWSDACVNLAIFDANGRPLENPPTSVTLLQGDDIAPVGGEYCCWMPYQKGQAVKTEALEQKLAEAKA